MEGVGLILPRKACGALRKVVGVGIDIWGKSQYCYSMVATEWCEVRRGIFVSSDGKVAREAGGEDIGTETRVGYRHVSVKARTVGVHRLVAEAFLGPSPSPGHYVNHKNGVKWDNRAENLEWATPSENQRHSFDVLGRKARRGEAVHAARRRNEMGRQVSITEKGPENTVISYRQAATLARGLRAKGWAVTGALCRGKTPAQVARLLVGPITGQQEQLTREIAVMCGYVPALEEQP